MERVAHPFPDLGASETVMSHLPSCGEPTDLEEPQCDNVATTEAKVSVGNHDQS